MKENRFSSIIRGYVALIKGELLAFVMLGFITLVIYLITSLL